MWSRPRIQDLELRLYDRPLTMTWEAVASRTIRRNDYTFAVHLTSTGHVLEWSNSHAHLVELTATHDEPLPPNELLTHRFQGERRGRRTINGVRYEVSLHAEVLPAEVFLYVHDELCAEGAKRGLMHYFAPHTRLSIVPLGLVTIEALPSGLSVATFHTFPSECAVVKTQSLIEPPLNS